MVLWGQGNWDELWQDFADLPDLAHFLRVALRLVLAAVLGGVLGFQRERTGKQAGLRTHMLVSLGAALFVSVAERAGMAHADLGRIIQGIVTGIGFIGGGAILKLSEEHQVRGLTTAANIYLAAAVGVAVGLGRLGSAILGTVLALIILVGLRHLEAWIDRRNDKTPPAR
jgi:putative Mg2+ transporter-C (MgtC) family protein